ncbi:MAG: hypothetical protein CMG81_02345 [Marinobacter sp.]|nr:hypothetical protein [Marinobacter sp.]
MLSFALNYGLFGEKTFSFKLTNLIIHYINSILVYFLSLKLFSLYEGSSNDKSIKIAAVFVALFWALHPLNLTNVLYVVQRMNSLSALFTLAGLVSYVYGRQKMLSRKSPSLGILLVGLGFFIFLPLSAFSKENGIIFLGFAAIIELSFFKLRSSKYSFLLVFYYFIFILVFLFFVIGFFLDWHSYSYASLSGGGAYDFRDFTLLERLMTQGRVLCFYLSQVVLPNITSLTLFHDDFVISRSLTDPISTIYALIFWVVTVVGACYFIFKNKVYGYFGIVWFLVGHSMESSIFPLELVHEHRNYIPMLGVLVNLGFIFLLLTRNRRLVFVGLLSVIFLFFLGTHARSYSWATWESLVHTEVKRAPKSSRSHYQLGRWYFAKVELQELDKNSFEFEMAKDHFLKSMKYNRVDITGGLAIVRLYDLVGEPLPESIISALEDRMSKMVMTTDNSNKFVEYIFCQIDGKCADQIVMTNRFINAVIDNPLVIGNQRELFLKTAAAYTISKGLVEAYIFYISEYLKLVKFGDPDVWQSFILVLRGTEMNQELLGFWLDEYKRRFGYSFGVNVTSGGKDGKR